MLALSRLSLQNRMPEVYREQITTKHALNMDQAFLQFLDKMDEQAKLDRLEPRLIEDQSAPVVEDERASGNDPFSS